MVKLLATAWIVLVVAAATRWRPIGRNIAVPVPTRHPAEVHRPIGERFGRFLVPRRWSLSATRHAQIGLGVPAALVGVIVWAPLGAAAALVAWAVPLRRLREATRARRREITRDLPDVVDLFILAFGAGLNVRLAVETVARSGHGPIVERLAAALDRADQGQRLHAAIAAVPQDLGDGVRPLVRVLADLAASPSDRRDQLAVVAVDARFDRRRAAEIEARQVPVRLLFPLVLAVLPAFGLLTVVPIVAGSLRSVSG
jgi:tight adherence protein C